MSLIVINTCEVYTAHLTSNHSVCCAGNLSQHTTHTAASTFISHSTESSSESSCSLHPPVAMSSFYSQLYTADTLTHDCVGRYITKSQQSASPSSSSSLLHLSSLLPHATYAATWQTFIAGIANHYSIGHSIHIPPLGIIQPSKAVRHNPSTGVDSLVSTSKLLFHTAFLQHTNITLSPTSPSSMPLPSHVTPSALHLNPSTLARLVQLDSSTYSLALSHLMQRLAAVLSERREQVSVDMGVGLLVAMDGRCEFLFHDQREEMSKSEDEKRTPNPRLMTKQGEADRAAIVERERARRQERLAPGQGQSEGRQQRAGGVDKPQEEEKVQLEGDTDSTYERRIVTPAYWSQHLPRLLDLSQRVPLPLTNSAVSDTMEGVPLAMRHMRGQPPLQPLRDALAQRQGQPAADLHAIYPSSTTPSPSSRASLSSLFTAKLPPLLDAYSRTQAAPNSSTTAANQHSASARIGAHYGSRQSVEEAVGLEGPLSSRAVDKSNALYEYYMQHIDQRVIAPYKQQWLQAALSLLSTDVSLLSAAELDAAMSALLSEVQGDYYHAIKRSMLDYILMAPSEQQRLHISHPPPPLPSQWTDRPPLPPPPPQWRPSIQRAFRNLSTSLQLNHPAFLFLLGTWSRYSHLSLFSPPPATSLSLSPRQFEAMQRAHMSDVTGVLKGSWLSEVEVALAAMSRTEQMTDDTHGRFFDTIACVMSQQLRTIIERSVQQLHAYIASYNTATTLAFTTPSPPALSALVDPSNTARQPAPLFGNKAIIHRSKDGALRLDYEHPLVDLAGLFDRLCDAMLHALDGIHRVETRIFNILDASRTLNMCVTGRAGEAIERLRGELQAVVMRTRKGCEQLLALYDRYSFLLDEDKAVATYLVLPHPLSEHQQRMASYRVVRDDVASQVGSVVSLPVLLLSVDCRHVNEMLVQRSDDCIAAIGADIAARNVSRSLALTTSCKTLATTLLRRPTNTRELVDLQAASLQFKQVDRKLMRAECDTLRAELEFMFVERCVVEQAVLSHVGSCCAWLAKLDRIVGESEVLIESERGRMEHEIEERMEAHNAQCTQLSHTIRMCETMSEKSRMAEYLLKLAAFKQQIATAETDIATLQEQERMLGMSPADVQPLSAIKAYLQPFDSLWSLASHYHKQHQGWMRGSVLKLDAAEVEREVGEMSELAARLQKQLETSVEVRKVADYLAVELQHMTTHLPLLQVLCNAGMRERHWAEVSTILGFHFTPDQHTTLARVLDMNVAQHVAALSAISDMASKEYHVEHSVASMRAEWADVQLHVRPQHDTYILVSDTIDECTVMLDDHTVKVSTLKASPFATPFMSELKALEAWLASTSSILSLSSSIQQVWLYLSPLFAGADIALQMPSEGALFAKVDNTWKTYMAGVSADLHVTAITALPHLHTLLQDTLKQLEQIQAGLHHYLESKRLYFPRLFFLSNDDLLSLLSETKDPRAVLPHIKKLFDGVHTLLLSEQEEVTSMVSSAGETAHLVGRVRPSDARGAVERWLKELEAGMRESMKDYARRALTAYSEDDRLEWMVSWPAQTAQVCSSIQWTADVTRAIQHTGKHALAELLDRANADLIALVNRMRQPLRPLERLSLSSMVVLDVHARDVVQSLQAGGVTDVNHFDWQAQLRYYWNHLDDSMEVKLMHTTLPYQCEYTGSTQRLVIAPLTDRCYRTLAAAIHLNMSGATEGPSGAGKTDTIKELARAVGTQCVSFNMQDGLDVASMGKLFKGLCCTGAWSCFDEFNRISLPVLSVIAQQLSTIQQAKAARSQVFNLDGADIALQPSTNVFVTMNPTSSASRVPLPDNLRKLFRCMSMTQPDTRLIAELLLYSNGFVLADRLSDKLVGVLSLCTQTLGSQPHYDWGMRGLKAVISTAIQHRTQHHDADEVAVLRSAIVAVNRPKLLSSDVPLFEGVMRDMFGAEQSEADESNELLYPLVVAEAHRAGLQATPAFVSKVLQLYQTIRIRHGVMLVGESHCGKTQAIQVLAAALNSLAQDKFNMASEMGVEYATLNPKALTVQQLYGHYSTAGGKVEFVPGLLKHLFEQYATVETLRRRWLVFDGAVDALWVESLNSVLDDNRKLCLPDGHVIHMTQQMSVLFEVSELSAASPATVSRCGMVHMSPEEIGWRSLVRSDAVAREYEALFELFVEPLWSVVRQGSMYSPVSQMTAVQSCVRLLAAQAAGIRDDAARDVDMQAAFLFALVWSLGAAVDGDTRPHVDQCIRARCAANSEHVQNFPAEGSVYDYSWSLASHSWTAWSTQADSKHIIPLNTPYHSIVIPTPDTACYQSLLTLLTQHRNHALLVGVTGSGKSVIVHEALANLPAFEQLTIHFSARTSAHSTQSTINSRLERRRKGVYGASHNRRCVVVIEDLNLPLPDTYGSQPVWELVRQHIDHRGGWNVREKQWHELEDVSFIAAMAPSGGGRQRVSERLLRHFHTLTLTPFTGATIRHIFTSILSWHFSTQQFVPSIAELTSNIVTATTDLYALVSANLLPTPQKTHYTYNVRDLSRVFQGLLLSPASAFPSPEPFIRLWIHEVHRVFADRLIDDTDSQAFLEWVRELTQQHFNFNFPQLMAHLDQDHDGLFTAQEVRSLFFGDYMSRHRLPRQYVEITDLKRLHIAWSVYQDDLNASSNKPSHLTLFRFAIEHVSRIARILREDRGHALLVGVGGSGKQSLTRLAASVMDYEVRSIELTREYGDNEWKRDLRAILRSAVLANQHTVLLLSDSELRADSMLEDVSGLLQVGAVPNLWPAEEMAEVCELVRDDCKRHRSKWSAAEPSSHELFEYFTSRVRRNLHVVLCMSPEGRQFADRLRMFPALANCCHMDYYAAWPQDALYSVAKDFLSEIELEEGQRDACVDLCIYLHRDVEAMATAFSAQHRRPCHVTPTSYLELITTFKTLLAYKRKETTKRRQRYLTGLDKLNQSEREVLNMQFELEQLQPVLEKTRAETNEMMALVQQETADAELIRAGVAQEEKVANQAAMIAKSIENECEAELASAMPLLDAANAALDTLTPAEISELRAMKAPPKGVKLVCEALCVMKRIAPARVPDGKNNGNFIADYWEPSKKHILSDPRLLKSLIAFDKDDVPAATIKKIRTYLALPEFELSKLKAVSSACHSIAQWIYAIEQYDRVIKQIQPKREALAKAKDEYGVMERGLQAKQAELRKVEEKMSGLNQTLRQMEEARNDLEGRMSNCSVKIDRANILISRLGGERERWMSAADALADRYAHLTGDMLLASGVIAYLGPFTASYRQTAIERWSAKCAEVAVPFTAGFSLSAVLGDAVQTRRWVIEGLPNDTFSIENALIISKSRRWPLMIDPQGQAAAWIKNMEKDTQLLCVKAGDEYHKQLETAITAGTPCLLQDCTEQLDPALDALLLKQVYKRNGVKTIRFRDAELPIHDSFRLFLTTRLKTPHYLPEVAVKVTMLDFSITSEGLRDQLLAAVVKREKAELEVERHRLVIASASNASRLKELEEKILAVMSSSKADILNDEHAIDVLSASKAIVNEIEDKQRVASTTEAEIEHSRQAYAAVAMHASVLFFTLMDLSPIEATYQFSLQWFLTVFQSAIDRTDKSDQLATRISTINSQLTAQLCARVSRAVFQKDRLLFGLLLAVRLSQARGEVSEAQWRFLLTPSASAAGEVESVWNCSRWLGDRGWNDLVRLCATADRLAQLHVEWKADEGDDEAWKAVAHSSDPYRATFPRHWNELAAFDRLCVVRCLCPERLLPAIRWFVGEQLGAVTAGSEFASVDWDGVMADSDCRTPLLCLLQPDCDVDATIEKLASDRACLDRLCRVSLGGGDNKHAVALIERAREEGLWLIVENLHLATDFLPPLDALCERLADSSNAVHTNHRLFLTSYPTAAFPLSILHSSLKVAVQPALGLRANLLALYSRDPLRHSTFFLSSPHASTLHSLTFALSFFHATLRERKRYLGVGFTADYRFSDTDYLISLRQLAAFVNEEGAGAGSGEGSRGGRRSGVSSYAALRYLVGELNYGGTVTDEWDRRLIRTLLRRCINEQTAHERHVLRRVDDFEYCVPAMGDGSVLLPYINSLAEQTSPDVLGLHPNAAISAQRRQTQQLLISLLLTTREHQSDVASANSLNHTVDGIAASIIKQLPLPFDLAAIDARFPAGYEQPLNSMVRQECQHYNRLLGTIQSSLATLRRALSGQQVVSAELESLSSCLFRSDVPHQWMAVSYPSLRPLAGYIDDLVKRCAYMREWVESGSERATVWLGGLFHARTYLSVKLQQYARTQHVSVDTVHFSFHVRDEDSNGSSPATGEGGLVVSGLWLEGAKWNNVSHSLDECDEGELFASAPTIVFQPSVQQTVHRRTSLIKGGSTVDVAGEESAGVAYYPCPLYSTSGRSECVLSVDVPMSGAADRDLEHWVQRGVALLIQLDD